MNAGARRILYFDSDPEARLLMREVLALHHVDMTESEDEARSLAREHGYDVYIVSGGGPGSPGLALCAWLHRIDAPTPIVFCSSNGTTQYQQLAVAAGALRFQVKPLDPALLRSTLGLLLKLAEFESTRALVAARHAVEDGLIERSRRAREMSRNARSSADRALECLLRVKAYRAFREAGGNRANFERMWAEAQRADKPAA
jgi:DNA-binding response OmpR family regulator